MSKLYLARHGETDFNVENRYAGTLDISLNEKGLKQSQKLAEELAELPIDVLVCSSKKRAIQTAQIINSYLDVPFYLNDNLIERDLGIYEGLTRKEAGERYPMLWERQVLHVEDNVEHGGESVAQVKQRAKLALEEILAQHQGKNILIVAHGYLIRMMNGILKNLSEEEINSFLLDNCEVAEYEIN